MASGDPAQASTAQPSLEVATRGKVIPPREVVILREAELDCDLATAIQRVRQSDETQNSRILIIGPEEHRPGTPCESSEPTVSLPVPTMPTSVLQVARTGGEEALAELGKRCQPLLDTLERFFEEACWVLDEIDEAAEEGIRARLKSRVRVARDVASWIECVIGDLQVEVRSATDGRRTVDLQALMQEAQGHVETFFPGVRVSVAPAAEDLDCHGHPSELAEACFLALVLTAHRIGGQGSITVEPNRETAHLGYRILGLGEPARVQAPAAMARLREIVIERHGGSLQPGDMGPFGTGLQLRLPG